MSKFKESIRKYKHEVRRSKQIPPYLGFSYPPPTYIAPPAEEVQALTDDLLAY